MGEHDEPAGSSFGGLRGVEVKYIITRSSSSEAAASLRKTLEYQKQFPLPSNFDNLVISDARLDVELKQHVDPSLSGPGGYWHGRIRNLAIKSARESDADYLVLLDSDAVFTGFPNGILGGGDAASDFERCFVFYQSETPEKQRPFLGTEDWQWNSWWIFSRKMFTDPRCVSHEGFIGYGWDDFDFLYNVAMPNGFHMVNGLARGVHLWHPPKRGEDEDVFNLEFMRNKRLFETRYRDIHGKDFQH